MNPEEKEKPVESTTPVGGHPPGGGRGVEALLNKAAENPDFIEVLLKRRAGAAAVIKVKLDPPEQAMLASVSEEQLMGMILQTVIQKRRAAKARDIRHEPPTGPAEDISRLRSVRYTGITPDLPRGWWRRGRAKGE